MPQFVLLPPLGEAVTEGTVTRWLKEVGDVIEADEPLLEISTDKVDTEVPARVTGVLERIVVGQGESAKVGAVLAIVSGDAAADDEPAHQGERAGEHEGEHAAPDASPTPAPTSRGSGATAPHGQYVTPLVRRLANERGIDVTTVVGTGVGGRIRKEDVYQAVAKAGDAPRGARHASAEPAAGPSSDSADAADATPRRDAARRASRQQSPDEGQAPPPHAQPGTTPLTTAQPATVRLTTTQPATVQLANVQLTTVVEVDVTRIVWLRARTREAFRAREGVDLTLLAFFVAAAAEALQAHPKVASHGPDAIGIAIDTNHGPAAPVIRDAGRLGLVGLARRIASLVGRARADDLSPDELAGATFTVTDPGADGALLDTPIIPAGTAAILAVGAVAKRPVVVTDDDAADRIVVRDTCYLALCHDHRLVDRADATHFLAAIKARIEVGAYEAELGC